MRPITLANWKRTVAWGSLLAATALPANAPSAALPFIPPASASSHPPRRALGLRPGCRAPCALHRARRGELGSAKAQLCSCPACRDYLPHSAISSASASEHRVARESWFSFIQSPLLTGMYAFVHVLVDSPWTPIGPLDCMSPILQCNEGNVLHTPYLCRSVKTDHYVFTQALSCNAIRLNFASMTATQTADTSSTRAHEETLSAGGELAGNPPPCVPGPPLPRRLHVG
ncbi:hypothetical protein BD626DRAFT_497147 [Schizophyllum amplum]|uniref:Uncharacterized protein n=1 Tax=Schizophyllum amplum TaxID=97359 RepID=A0A550CDT1_9AGAR|nr:hypothetical protein BD626DRAFT_497147 [Auriculariopsis ampla]